MQSCGTILSANTRTLYAEFKPGVEEGMHLVLDHAGKPVRVKVTYLQAGARGTLVGNAEIIGTTARPPAAGTELRVDTSDAQGTGLIPIGVDDWGQPVFLRLNDLFQHLLLAGTTTSGKTELALTMGEHLMGLRVPHLIIDTQDEFLGMRDVFPSDVLVTTDPREALAGLRMRKCVIASLLQESSTERLRVATTLLTTLMDAKSQPGADLPPALVTIDEGEIFAPSTRTTKEARACLAAVEALAKRGAKLGIGVTIISNRPTALHVDVRSQCNTGALFRLQDGSSIQAVKHLGLTRYDVNGLGTLERGRCMLVGRAATRGTRIQVTPTNIPRPKNFDFATQLGIAA